MWEHNSLPFSDSNPTLFPTSSISLYRAFNFWGIESRSLSGKACVEIDVLLKWTWEYIHLHHSLYQQQILPDWDHCSILIPRTAIRWVASGLGYRNIVYLFNFAQCVMDMHKNALQKVDVTHCPERKVLYVHPFDINDNRNKHSCIKCLVISCHINIYCLFYP